MCVSVCPFGGVTADPVAHKALKCDRCPERTANDLDPACVSACPTQALQFVSPEEITAKRRHATAMAAIGKGVLDEATGMDILRSLKGAL